MNTEAESHLRGTAYHEAAHAVVAWRLGLDVHSIVLREQGADCETNTESPTVLPLTDQLAIYLAGQKASVLFDCPLPEDAGSDDRRQVAILLEGLSAREDRKQRNLAYERAHEFLMEHQDKVRRLADHLRDTREVDAAEFLRLMKL